MTLKELNNIRYLKRAVENMEERIARLNAKLRASGGSFDGMPHGSGEVHSAVEENALKRIVLLSRFERLQERYLAELGAAMDFIESIEDLYLREIFMQRFVDGRSWEAVARKLGSTAGSAQELCYRYLRRSEE